VYATKKAYLQELEKLSEQGLIDLFYGDESYVSSEGYIPYGFMDFAAIICLLLYIVFANQGT
jgi:hypothetical protein